jgi:hypothetical protein
MDEPSPKLSQEEREALPETVKRYILALENELDSLKRRLQSNEGELRRKRFAYWNR